MTEQSRLPLLRKDDLPATYQVYLSEEYRGEPNFFRALANNPLLLESLFDYSAALSEDLSSRDREIATLVASKTIEAEYIWHQHVKRSRGDELSIEEIQAIGKEETSPFNNREKALLAYAQAVAQTKMTDETFDRLAAHYSEDCITAFTMLIGFYVGLDTFMDAINIPLEEDFIGWVPDT